MFPLFDDMTKKWFAPMTWLLIVINLLISFLFFFHLTPEDSKRLLTTVSVISKENYNFFEFLIRTFISMHLHSGFSHLFFNMLFLFAFGLSIENKLGKLFFLTLYYSSGLYASVLYYVLTNHNVPTLGASGAISGVIAAYLILFPKARFYSLLLVLWVVRFLYIPAWIYIVFWILGQLYAGLFVVNSNVAYEAHLGGIIFGILFGVLSNIIWFLEQKVR